MVEGSESGTVVIKLEVVDDCSVAALVDASELGTKNS